MKNLLNFFVIILSIFVFTTTSSGQQIPDNIIRKNDPYRAALGQTKWLKRTFTLDESTSNLLYQVFLKYELQKDSARYLSIDEKQKREILFKINQNTKKDLSLILSKQNYNDYLDMLEKTESQIPKREL
jgi:hypothetical protein